MRRKAISPKVFRRGSRALTAILFAAIAYLSPLVPATPALAGTVTNERPLLFSFDGSDTTAGAFKQPYRIAIDNDSEAVYVGEGEGSRHVVDKFHSDGTASTFLATGTSSLAGSCSGFFTNLLGVAVDNSTVNRGHLYVSQFGEPRLNAFDSSGGCLWSLFPGAQFDDVAVDAAGYPWIASNGGLGSGSGVAKYENTAATSPKEICKLAAAFGRAIDVDANDNVYVVRGNANVEKYVNAGKECKPEEKTTLDTGVRDVYVDQVTEDSEGHKIGHIFTIHAGNFNEYTSDGALVKTYGAEGEYLRRGSGIGYLRSRNWVYVLQSTETVSIDPTPVVAVFGPPASGTVPDVTIDPVSSPGISTTHLSGKVNPKGVSSTWHFEWKRPNQSWAAAQRREALPAQSSEPRALPVDEAGHIVEFDTNELRGNTEYEGRLVTVNDANNLRSVSEAKEFTTLTAPAPPTIEEVEVTDIEASEATVKAKVNPKGDSFDWRVQESVGEACASAFSDEPLQTHSKGSTAPVAVEWTLKGLLPSESYCARILATNSAGTTTSEVVEFETKAVAPSEVETTFAAPRTDTAARINGRVNPEGEELSYRFEYSADEGETWQKLPEQVNTSEAREKIVVGQELGRLSPNTTYRYRLVAKNAAGPASSQGEEKAFTTRPPPPMIEPCPNADVRANQHSEYLPDCRGIELVNNPDKGNQYVNMPASSAATPKGAATSDGEMAIWVVLGGAPGAYNGAGNYFLAARTLSGWRSQDIAPPPDQQLGEGGWDYALSGATTDFSHFVFGAVRDQFAAVLVRLDRDLNQEPLKAYPEASPGNIDLSSDGAHVVLVNPETGQLEDIGGARVGPPAVHPVIVSIMPDGKESSCGLETGGKSFIGGEGEGGAATHWQPGYHMIATTDAFRVYFQAKPNKPNGECEASGLLGLYVRNREAGQTTLIDLGTGGHSPEFIRTTPDGRSAYFATYSQYSLGPVYSKLDPADTNGHADVYRWDEETGKATCLTCEANPDVNLYANSGRLTRILVSDDFSHLYFESREQLAQGTTPGHVSVYVLSGGTIRFVADTNNNEGALRQGEPHLSADGNVLVFDAKPTSGLTSDAVASGVGGELYRYDDRDGSLECISCRYGEGEVTTHPAFGAQMSRDGSTVAFTTAEALAPLDVNHGIDIYEWRNGARDLITDGVSDFQEGAAAPQVRAMDDDGSNIFFTLVAPGLTGFEQDGLSDAYDTRVGGGFEPPSPSAHCTEDSCQGPLQAAPPRNTRNSSTYSGPGNIEGMHKFRCPKGKVRRHGHCVKRRNRHAKRAHRKHGGAK